MSSCAYKLQIVSITVRNVVIHCGHCVSTITCFPPSDSVLLAPLGFFFPIPSPGLHSPQQAVMPSSLLPYIWHVKEIKSPERCLFQFFIC